jgi:hypothetical protein
MNAKLIVIDGKTYRSVDEMSPDVRQKYEQAMHAPGDTNDNNIPDAFESMNIFADKNKNGVPDMLENVVTSNTVVNSMKIIIDGKEFNSIEHLPPEARAKYENAMAKLDANRNGIPDFVEGMINTTNQTANISTSFGTETSPDSPPLSYPPSAMISQDKPLPVSPTIEPDTSNSWMLALAGLFLVLLCVASVGGVWYFFLR